MTAMTPGVIREAAHLLDRLDRLMAAWRVAMQDRTVAQVEVRGTGWVAVSVPVDSVRVVIEEEMVKVDRRLAELGVVMLGGEAQP